jgi:UDP-N-acetylmuramate: L-alanyl-gamma-D-glutamyl-meso-diaminopimelate ligase
MQVHFIAIGGSVMHQLAIALKRKGYAVTGSDDEIFEPARANLEKESILPAATGWFPEKINEGIDAVILGMHARADNPELIKARELGLTIYSFPEYIYEESRTKTRVAIGGSHGKTSTTAMVMHVLKFAGRDFDYLVGARLDGFDQSVNISDAPVIVCEADEYPASVIEKRPKFHFLFPHIAVITGIAWDHINVFPTFDFYLEQFVIFINKIEAGGILIYNSSDETLEKLVNGHKRNDIRYEKYSLPTYFIEDGKTEVIIEGIKSFPLKVFGNHNLLNLHAAWLVCKELGVSAEIFIEAITGFAGAAKRLELLASRDNYNIYRDFAHAPSKVKATIEAVKQQFPQRKLIAVLELHTFSSLNENFMKEYKGAMEPADTAVVFYSSHALELKRMPPLPAEKVKEGFGKKDLAVINTREELEKFLLNLHYADSNLLLMSSGTYDGLDIVNLPLYP